MTTAGFLLALLLTAAIRELLGAGTLLGAPVFSGAPLPMTQLTCGGFFVVGLLAALWRGMRNLFKKIVTMEANTK